MKKILSVALSTAMAFSMFASVAFGDTAVSPQQQFDALKAKGIFEGFPNGTAGLDQEMTRGQFAKVITKLLGLKEVTGQLSYTDKNYNAKNWAVPYIEAVTAAGIMQGKDTTKKIFDFNGKVTIAEMATILTRALDLEVPAETNNNAPEWAKKDVQAAINAGLVDANANFTANASRQLLVGAAYAVDQAQSLKVASYEVSEAGKVVTFKISDGESVKVTLDKALEANKETEVKFTYKEKEFTEKVTYVVTTATKVQSATATNLKEVIVKFDGKVDKDSAENVVNYTLKSGKVIDSVTLSDDQTSATLLLKDSVLTNNRTDAVSVSNVKAGTATVSATNVEFTAVDNVLPEVTSVQSLGTKSVKVVFSEPVKGVSQTNFTLDGKEYFGKVTVSNNFKTVVLTPYSTTALAVGDHKLTVSGVKDYADFVSLASTHDIKVVEDTTAPTITEATATLESVTVTFSEDVDVDTIDAAKVYWKSGDNKITAESKKQLADNKWQFTFGVNKSLPTGSVSIFVEGVKDYSGNQIAANTSVVVTPVIDQVRPEVSSVTTDDSQTIKITFSKTVLESSATNPANYTVKDKDGKTIAVQSATLDTTDKKVVRVKLYTALSVGDNTLTIQNVKDDTKLQNTMVDYTSKVNLVDKAAPAKESSTVNVDQKRVVVKFDKAMDVASLTNYSNYLVTIDGTNQALTPAMAEITPIQDATAVSIKFAESLNGKTVMFGASNGVNQTVATKLTLLALKSANGTVLSDFTNSATNGATNEISLTSNSTALQLSGDAELTDRRTVKVKFDAGINNYTASNAIANANGNPAVSSIEVNGTSTVTVKFASDLNTDGSNVNLTVDYTKFVTNAGNAGVGPAGTVNTTNLKDSVKPVVVVPSNNVLAVSANKITVDFSEVVKSASNELAAGAFTVQRVSDGKDLVPGTDFTVARGTNTTSYVITLKDAATRTADTAYRVSVLDNKLVTDNAATPNSVAAFNGTSALVSSTASTAPLAGNINASDATHTVSVTGLTAGDKVTVYSDAALTTEVGSQTVATGASTASVTDPSITNGDTLYVTVTSTGKLESPATTVTVAP
ncbi:S-layer homology domain-containing protein [Paenibacillus polysaccharolyticus]|uniref:S-layer homology domain-containing protein n=1 Tax=Paenibacillus polysaccharolyticus TaxID=582692 RepID=UPI00203D8A98|nr:S-layer homology domain-containing protein [Paenibacillus polysaccharolyticus]MCM3134922.1 S-layer homology domain-containing protein [Paenibacillus polysaccharolyticus]